MASYDDAKRCVSKVVNITRIKSLQVSHTRLNSHTQSFTMIKQCRDKSFEGTLDTATMMRILFKILFEFRSYDD